MIQSHARSRFLDQSKTIDLPKNHRRGISDDETVAGCLQGLSEEEIRNRGEEEIRQHGVKCHNTGVFGDVEREIHG